MGSSCTSCRPGQRQGDDPSAGPYNRRQETPQHMQVVPRGTLLNTMRTDGVVFLAAPSSSSAHRPRETSKLVPRARVVSAYDELSGPVALPALRNLIPPLRMLAAVAVLDSHQGPLAPSEAPREVLDLTERVRGAMVWVSGRFRTRTWVAAPDDNVMDMVSAQHDCWVIMGFTTQAKLIDAYTSRLVRVLSPLRSPHQGVSRIVSTTVVQPGVAAVATGPGGDSHISLFSYRDAVREPAVRYDKDGYLVDADMISAPTIQALSHWDCPSPEFLVAVEAMSESQVMSCTASFLVSLHDAESGKVVQHLPLAGAGFDKPLLLSATRQLHAVSPSIVAVCAQRESVLIDTRSNAVIAHLPLPKRSWRRRVASLGCVSSISERVFVMCSFRSWHNSGIHVYDVRHLGHGPTEPLGLSKGHQDGIWAAMPIPGTSLLATASRDTTIRVWDLARREQIGRLHTYQWHRFLVPLPSLQQGFATWSLNTKHVSVWNATAL